MRLKAASRAIVTISQRQNGSKNAGCNEYIQTQRRLSNLDTCDILPPLMFHRW